MEYRDIILEILGITVIFVLNYLKQNIDFKKAHKENSDQHKELFKMVGDLTEKSTTVTNLFDGITIAGITVIQSNVDLDSKVIRLMNATISQIRDFAIRFNNSAYRKTKQDLKEYLFLEAENITSNLDVLADDIFLTKSKSGVQISYSQFSKEFSDIEVLTRILIKKLIDNGLSRKQYQELFTDFIKELLLEEIKLWRRWRRDKF